MKRIILALVFLTRIAVSQAQMTEQYTNPILSGFYPDPSICRVKDDYYLVSSTFAYFPGIPVFHSKDLVHWKLIGHVMDRAEQMDLTGFGVSRGIFAPGIRYHNGLFYVTCTLVDGKGNFVVTAKDPAGPWSNPVWLTQIDGIDPCLFFDDNGKTYIIYNSIPPGNKPRYSGHRTIRIRSFDLENLKAMDDERILVNGGTDLSKKPSWIEGPHLLKKDGYYYLIAAEGGTGADHSVVAFRSSTIDGTFIPYEHNPILTQRNLDASRSFPITSTGHADLVEIPGGWQAVFLGCRPYEGDHYNTGRETFLAPVIWKDGWPLLNPGYDRVQFHYPVPIPGKPLPASISYSGNFSYRDDFDSKQPGLDWMFLRTPKEKWYALDRKKGSLSLQLRPQTCAGKDNPSFLARRQQHLRCSASTSLSFDAAASNEKAGLAIFQNEDHFYYLCRSVDNKKQVVQLYRSLLIPADSNQMELIATYPCRNTAGPVYLKITADKTVYNFYVSEDGKKWQAVKEGMDARFLSTRTAGGFVGATFALYATSLGQSSSTSANYDWFSYEGHDERSE
jgi:alpha-N-arabinofuranosidase